MFLRHFFSLIILTALLFVALFKPSNCSTSDAKEDWGYKNKGEILPADWPSFEPKCKGLRQSPINVEIGKTTYDQGIGILQKKLSGLSAKEEKWEVKNNGHSVVFTPKNVNYSLISQPGNESFILEQMHFHWRGSEHFLDSIRYAGEIHLVHQSQQDPQRLNVISFLIKLVSDNNPQMDIIINQLANITSPKSAIELNGNFSLQDIIPLNHKNFFRYSGSLTTPSCDETVEWNIVDSPILQMSDNQLLDFQTLYDQDNLPLLTNARPLQALNGRVVRRSFDPFLTLTRPGNNKTVSKYKLQSSLRYLFSLFIISFIIVI